MMRKRMCVAIAMLLSVMLLVSCEDDPCLSEELNSIPAAKEPTVTCEIESTETSRSGEGIRLPMDKFN